MILNKINMNENQKKYQGIKFLKVEQQFSGAKKLSTNSSKFLSIKPDFLSINQQKRNSIRSSSRNSIKSSARKSIKSSAKKSIKSSLKENKSVNISKKEKSNKKKNKNKNYEIIKTLIELQKEGEKSSKEIKMI